MSSRQFEAQMVGDIMGRKNSANITTTWTNDDTTNNNDSNKGARIVQSSYNMSAGTKTNKTGKTKESDTSKLLKRSGMAKARIKPSQQPKHHQQQKKKKLSLSSEQRWNAMYDQLVEYERMHGHCLVPQQYRENPKLGRWVRNQRVEYRYYRAQRQQRRQQQGNNATASTTTTTTTTTTSYLTQERINRLNQIGFVWDAKKDAWDARFRELQAFRTKFGHVNVSAKRHGFTKYTKLESWVRNQRMHYSYIQRGDDHLSTLTPQRIKQLNSLGFIWDVNDASWMEKFDLLCKYKKENGHCNVPSQYEADPSLARWVLQQRVQYKAFMKDKGQNPMEGGGEEVKDDDDVLLKEDRDDDGSCDETKSQAQGRRKKHTGTSLPRRRNERKRGITQKRIDLLDSINFVWDPTDANWWEQYHALKAYKEEHGHCLVPWTNPPSIKLRNWVTNQRRLCRQYVDTVTSSLLVNITGGSIPVSGLNEERIKALRDIEFCYLPDPNAPLEEKQHQLRRQQQQQRQVVQSLPPPSTAVSPARMVDVVQKKQKEEEDKKKKPVIPFPWDEL